MILADTGAIVALVDTSERNHSVLRALFEDAPGDWLLPWAILPEVDYLLAARVGQRAARAFCDDLASGSYFVEWGRPVDLVRAAALQRKHASLELGLVDAVVLAVAERLRAGAIATLDLRHFSTVKLEHRPRLLPRDL